MRKLLALVFSIGFAALAHAQSALLPANQIWAGPPSGGAGFARARAMVVADLPALASGQIFVGQASGFPGAVAMSGNCTLVASGAITCSIPLSSITGFGAGVGTALATAVGSAGGPVVNGGALGTPLSGTLTNATGLPLAGVTGFGTGVAAALAVNVGTAGAPVVNGGALGTPASGVATNLTGTAAGLTAGTVTTNANLTGNVTSAGNATTLAAGSAGVLNSGTLLAARMPALTGDVTTTVGTVATTLAAGSASNLNSGTLAAARGGAGTINGALKANGSGVVSQAACADLSNGGGYCSISAGPLIASIAGNVSLNNTASFFPGPAVAQGSTGTWFASGTVTLVDTVSAKFNCKLWDGTSTISAASSQSATTSTVISITLSGFLAAPAGNLRIDCQDVTSVNGTMLLNTTGANKDSTITAYRIN